MKLLKNTDELPGTLYQVDGRWQWKVKLPGETKRKSIALKPQGSRYATKDRKVAEYVARNRWRQAQQAGTESDVVNDGTVGSLKEAYLSWAQNYYRNPVTREPTGQLNKVRSAAQFLDPYRSLSVDDFNPLVLKEIQQTMIVIDEKKKKNRSRTVVNSYVSIIRQIFRWGVSELRVPSHILEGLKSVAPLKKGRSRAKEKGKVRSVDPETVRRIYPYTSAVVKAMLELQLCTGMRSGELCVMRPCDIDRTGEVWLYTPYTYKTQYRDDDDRRVIPVGKTGQAVLTPFLDRPPTAFCFSPREALEDVRQQRPSRHVGRQYDSNAYRKAVHYAVKAARKDTKNKDLPDFSPHQIRHTVATRVWNEFGPEACRALLGHSHLRMSREYADLELARAVTVVKKRG